MRVVPAILVLLAAIAVVVAAQEEPPAGQGSDTRSLADLVAEFERVSGKKVLHKKETLARISLAYVVPFKWQADSEWLRNVIEDTLLRSGLVLLTRDDGNFEVERADALPREISEEQLAKARPDDRVRLSIPVPRNWPQGLMPPMTRCRVEARSGTLELSGYARDVRMWHGYVLQLRELECGVARTYRGLALDAGQLRQALGRICGNETSVEEGADGPVITAAPQLHAWLEEALPRK